MSIIGFINDLKKKNIFLYHNQGKIKIIGPQELLTAELKQKIKRYKQEIIAVLKSAEEKNERGIPKADLSENGCYPLSREQKRMFVLNKLDESGTAYNMPLAVKRRGSVQISQFKDAWRQLIARHEALRTSFVTVDGEPMQKSHRKPSFN